MAREPRPVESETGTVPADNGLWTYCDQGLLPSRPVLSCKDSEELVEPGQARPEVLVFQDDELLAKCQVFKPEAPKRTEKANNRGQKEPDNVQHRCVLSQVACEWQLHMLLKTEADRLLARHSHQAASRDTTRRPFRPKKVASFQSPVESACEWQRQRRTDAHHGLTPDL
jgi:hypothetical protein